jgi:hypothetical protein
MTSMRTDPDGRVLKLNNPDLRNYPVSPHGASGLHDAARDEVAGLRKYLLAGGVLAVIDFWNRRSGRVSRTDEAGAARARMDRARMDHPIFHCVFDLKGPMQHLQVPTMQFWNKMHNPDDPELVRSPRAPFSRRGADEDVSRAHHTTTRPHDGRSPFTTAT